VGRLFQEECALAAYVLPPTEPSHGLWSPSVESFAQTRQCPPAGRSRWQRARTAPPAVAGQGRRRARPAQCAAANARSSQVSRHVRGQRVRGGKRGWSEAQPHATPKRDVRTEWQREAAERVNVGKPVVWQQHHVGVGGNQGGQVRAAPIKRSARQAPVVWGGEGKVRQRRTALEARNRQAGQKVGTEKRGRFMRSQNVQHAKNVA